MCVRVGRILIGNLAFVAALSSCKNAGVGMGDESSIVASLGVDAPPTTQIPYHSYSVTLTPVASAAAPTTTKLADSPFVNKFSDDPAANQKIGAAIKVPAGTYDMILSFYTSTDSTGTAIFSSDYCTGSEQNSKNIALVAKQMNKPHINVCKAPQSPGSDGTVNVVIKPNVINVNAAVTTCTNAGQTLQIKAQLCTAPNAPSILVCNAAADGVSAPTLDKVDCPNGCSVTTNTCNSAPQPTATVTCQNAGITYSVGATICLNGNQVNKCTDAGNGSGVFNVQTTCQTNEYCALSGAAPSTTAACQPGG